MTVLYFFFVVMLGGMVLPTVLIGVISIAFDDATKQIKEEKKEGILVQRTLQVANAWLPGNATEFMTDDQVRTLQKIFGDIDFDGSRGLDEVEIMPFLEYLADLSDGGSSLDVPHHLTQP